MVCGALKGQHLVGGFVQRIQAQAALALAGAVPSLRVGDQVDQRVVLEQRDVGRVAHRARSACAARPRRWRRSRARCGGRCGRLRGSGAAGPSSCGERHAQFAQPGDGARARVPPRSGWRPGRTGRRRPPACRRRGPRSCRPRPARRQCRPGPSRWSRRCSCALGDDGHAVGRAPGAGRRSGRPGRCRRSGRQNRCGHGDGSRGAVEVVRTGQAGV